LAGRNRCKKTLNKRRMDRRGKGAGGGRSEKQNGPSRPGSEFLAFKKNRRHQRGNCLTRVWDYSRPRSPTSGDRTIRNKKNGNGFSRKARIHQRAASRVKKQRRQSNGVVASGPRKSGVLCLMEQSWRFLCLDKGVLKRKKSLQEGLLHDCAERLS